jgi:hypothetical protein
VDFRWTSGDLICTSYVLQVITGMQVITGISGDFMDSRIPGGLHLDFRCFHMYSSGLHGIPVYYSGLQMTSEDFGGLHGTSTDFKVTSVNFMGLQVTTMDSRCLQRTSVDFTDYMGLQVSSVTFSCIRSCCPPLGGSERGRILLG